MKMNVVIGHYLDEACHSVLAITFLYCCSNNNSIVTLFRKYVFLILIPGSLTLSPGTRLGTYKMKLIGRPHHIVTP